MYPQRNPFPAQATAIIEGSPLGELDQLTLARPAVSRLSDLATRYRTSYDPAADDNGKAIAVHGEHGSGKTHALAHAMVSLAAVEGVPPVRVLYVRADSPDLLSLYRKLMSQLSLQDLQDLCRQARQQYAQEELAASRGLDQRALDVALETTEADGDWVARAFQSAELQATAVLDRQMSDLARQGLRQKDFERVVPNLLNRDLDEVAHRWLRGEQLADSELRALGITENIDDSLKVRTGIQTLLILSRRAGQRIAIFIDQAEALVTSGPGTLHLDNVGTLRAILEGVVGNSGLLVVAMRESVWQLLPPDLRQRFGPSEIQTTSLTEPEANDLVALFVAPRTSEEPRTRTYPLAPLGLREALVSSGGNIRRFIQLCSLLFTVAAPEERLIDRDFARNVLSGEATAVPTRDTLRLQLTDLLAAAHVPYQADYSLPGGPRVDFAVGDGAGGFRAFIVVTDALVGQPELGVANRTLALVQRATSQARPAEVVLIVGGYLSPELTAELSKVHRVIIVTGETGQSDLDALVADLRAAAPVVTATEAELRARLNEVLSALDVQQADRKREQRLLRQQINELGRAQGGQRQVGEVAETARQWRMAEEDLREKIGAARAERHGAELAELEGQRANAERNSRVLAVAQSLPFLLALAVLLIVGSQVNDFPVIFIVPIEAVLGLAACLVPLVFLWIRRRREGDLGKPVASVQELDRLAHGYLPSDETPASPSLTSARGLDRPAATGVSVMPPSQVPGTLIRSRNPQVTYAVGVSKFWFDKTDLTQLLAGQRSAIARRSLVRKLASDYDMAGFEAVLETIGSDPAASAAFDMFGALPMSSQQYAEMLLSPAYRRTLDGDISRRLSPDLLTVARLYGYRPEHDRDPRNLSILNGFLLPDIPYPDEPSRDSSYEEHRREVTGLRFAYEDGGDARLTGVLRAFTERELRTAAAGLSPFDTGRPGTFDWLDRIGDIDEMYLFFRKCLFYLARGIPADAVEI